LMSEEGNKESVFCSKGFVIAVSGLPGSGKSTLARNLARELGLRYVSSGLLFRSLAKEKGLSLVEFTKRAEQNYDIDRYIDAKALEEAKKGCVVVDGHIAAWIVGEHAHLKIYLDAPLEVRAERIAKRDGKPFQEALQEVRIRDDSEARRFREIYGIDVNDLKIFDVVINTTNLDEEACLRISLTAAKHIARKLLGISQS